MKEDGGRVDRATVATSAQNLTGSRIHSAGGENSSLIVSDAVYRHQSATSKTDIFGSSDTDDEPTDKLVIDLDVSQTESGFTEILSEPSHPKDVSKDGVVCHKRSENRQDDSKRSQLTETSSCVTTSGVSSSELLPATVTQRSDFTASTSWIIKNTGSVNKNLGASKGNAGIGCSDSLTSKTWPAPTVIKTASIKAKNVNVTMNYSSSAPASIGSLAGGGGSLASNHTSTSLVDGHVGAHTATTVGAGIRSTTAGVTFCPLVNQSDESSSDKRLKMKIRYPTLASGTATVVSSSTKQVPRDVACSKVDTCVTQMHNFFAADAPDFTSRSTSSVKANSDAESNAGSGRSPAHKKHRSTGKDAIKYKGLVDISVAGDYPLPSSDTFAGCSRTSLTVPGTESMKMDTTSHHDGAVEHKLKKETLSCDPYEFNVKIEDRVDCNIERPAKKLKTIDKVSMQISLLR